MFKRIGEWLGIRRPTNVITEEMNPEFRVKCECDVEHIAKELGRLMEKDFEERKKERCNRY